MKPRVRNPLVLLVGLVAFGGSIASCSSQPGTARQVSVPGSSTSTTAKANAPAATVPVSVKPEIDGAALARKHGEAVVSVLARSCSPDQFSVASGFAVDPRFVVTVRAALAEDPSRTDSPIDPKPWIRTRDGQWRRGTVIGVADASDVAVVRIDDGYSELPTVLGWAASDTAPGKWGVLLGYPGNEDRSLVPLATQVEPAFDSDDPSHVQHKITAAGLASEEYAGGPILNDAGQVVALQMGFDAETGVGLARGGSVAQGAVLGIVRAPKAVPGRCDADAKTRLALGWGVVIDPIGGPSSAAKLASNAKLRALGRIGAVDSDWKAFYPPDSLGPVVLGPVGSERQAKSLREKATPLLQAAGLDGPFAVDLLPIAAFAPAPTPPAYTTATFPPPTPPPPPTTKPRPTTSRRPTTTRPAASGGGACPPAGGRRLATIANGAPGLSVTMRAGPSSSAKGVALAANGYQVSVVVGSSQNGFSQVVLPESPPRCPWVENRYLG